MSCSKYAFRAVSSMQLDCWSWTCIILDCLQQLCLKAIFVHLCLLVNSAIFLNDMIDKDTNTPDKTFVSSAYDIDVSGFARFSLNVIGVFHRINRCQLSVVQDPETNFSHRLVVSILLYKSGGTTSGSVASWC